ncbi:hypothetical protein GGR56DRAFT_123102 [Xylariaceae sp. FL0804]|nr:hypothetical protein GGR56DRAFT_123102 [Xylariaceae sp. FL0804]
MSCNETCNDFAMSSSHGCDRVPLSKTCQNCYHLKIRCHRSNADGSCDRRIESLENKVAELMRERASSPKPSCDSPSPLSRGYGSGDDVVDSALLTMDDANALVETYRLSMTEQFPFVVLAPQVTAATLRQEKPFLFLCVLFAAAFHDMPLQRKLGQHVKQVISDRVTLGGTFTFEMLQGILVFIARSQYHPRPRRYTQYLHLAMSIIADLRLDRDLVGSWKPADGDTGSLLRPGSQERSHEMQRAFAGCFYLSSTIAKLLQKHNFFQYSNALEKCCESLLQEGKYPSDRQIYYIVQLQRIIDAIEFSSWQHITQEAATAAVIDVRYRLECFKANLPFALEDSQFMYMQYRTAELILCQAAFFEKTIQLEAGLHSELVEASFLAAKLMLEYYFALPKDAEKVFNNTDWVQIGFTLSVANQLIVMSSYQQRQTLDPSYIWPRIFARIQPMVTEQRDERGDRDVFYMYEERLRRIQDWLDRNNLMASGSAGPQQPHQDIPPSSVAAPHRDLDPRVPSSHPILPVPEINVIPSAETTPDSQLLLASNEPSMWAGGFSQDGASSQQMQVPALFFPGFEYFFQDSEWTYPNPPA